MERHGNVAGRNQAERHEAVLGRRKTRHGGRVPRGPRVRQEARRLSQLLPFRAEVLSRPGPVLTCAEESQVRNHLRPWYG